EQRHIFPTCGSRLSDAAPTELVACSKPVTIKILLLRSVPGPPTNVQTPEIAYSPKAISQCGFNDCSPLRAVQGRDDFFDRFVDEAPGLRKLIRFGSMLRFKFFFCMSQSKKGG